MITASHHFYYARSRHFHITACLLLRYCFQLAQQAVAVYGHYANLFAHYATGHVGIAQHVVQPHPRRQCHRGHADYSVAGAAHIADGAKVRRQQYAGGFLATEIAGINTLVAKGDEDRLNALLLVQHDGRFVQVHLHGLRVAVVDFYVHALLQFFQVWLE